MGQRVRHILVEHLHGVKITTTDKVTGFGKVIQMVLRQVLHLNNASSPSTCAVGTVKLEHTSGAIIGADRSLHRLVFLYRGLCKLLTEG